MADNWYVNTTNLNFSRTSQTLRWVLENLKARVNLKDKNDWTPLHCAAYLGCGKMTRILLENGADVNKVNGDGSTPLHLACHSDDAKCIQSILYHKPIMDIQDQDFNTPLIIFVRWTSHDERLLRRFLDAGADPDISDEDGYTPLHYVAQAKQGKTKQREIFARVLTDYGASVNLLNKYMNTPLHLAISRGFEAVVKILLENGAYINIENIFGFTPLDTAFSQKICIPNILEHIVKHLILQHSQGVLINFNYLNKICEIQSLQYFKDLCDRELLELKSNRVGESDVTYYDILISPPEKIAKFLRNEDILESLSEFEKKKYNVFGGELAQNFHQGLRIYKVVEIGYKFCKKVFPVIPDICIDKIINHLSFEDIGNLEQIIFS